LVSNRAPRLRRCVPEQLRCWTACIQQHCLQDARRSNSSAL
jgi:hypothetical protein